MADDRSDADLRKESVGKIVADMRAKTIKELADMEAEYDEDSKPFRVLLATSKADPVLKAAFNVILDKHKLIMKKKSIATMAALDAIEKDMFADLEVIEEQFKEHGESSFDKIYRLEDYYHEP